jgi:DNA polymerase-3 subunit gamma/tau
MSYQVIARKYRPQLFDEVVGQPLITQTLKNAIQTNRVAHGYIFSGARGVGKTTTARILAKALNCLQGPITKPCGECPSCREIAAGNSVDVLEIDAASNRGIDEIRELRETVRYLPARDRYKIFIIDEAHMLTTEAFNALLKTLEEPPPRSLFILATTEPHKLPSTIQSRCQQFAFRLLDYGEIYARLEAVAKAENIQAEDGALSALAQAAEGSLRDALSLLDQVIAACGERLDEKRVRQVLGAVPTLILTELLEAVNSSDARRVLEKIGQLCSEGYELAHFCGELTRLVRNLMVARSCGAESPLLQVPPSERPKLAELAGLFSEEDLSRFFQVLLRTESELRYSLQPRFHLELGLLKLVHARRLASLESLLSELGGLKPGEKPSGSPARGDLDAPPRSLPARPHSAYGPEPVEGQAGPKSRSPDSGPSAGGSGPLKKAVAEAPQAAGRARDEVSESGATQPQGGPSREGADGVRPVPQAREPLGPTSGGTSRPPFDKLGAVSRVERQGGEIAAASEDSRLAAIKALLFDQSKKFLSSCLEHVSGCRLENGEVHFLYAQKDILYAELLRSREQQDSLRAVCAQVLGQPVRICVTLAEQGVETRSARPSARERAERDREVEAFRKKFDCTWVDVQDLNQE